MATKFFIRTPEAVRFTGYNYPLTLMDGSTMTDGDIAQLLTTAAGGAVTKVTATKAGPTTGVSGGVASITDSCCWFYSDPLAAAVTISGTITFNIWALENSMSANATVGGRVLKYDADTGTLTEVCKATFGTELGTSSAVCNFTGTPTSTAFAKGDRIAFHVYFDDATAVTMASGFTCSFVANNATGGASGDSWVEFTETITTNADTSVTGSILYLTDTAGPAVGSDDEREMWTSRGSGVVSTDSISTVLGPTAALQFKKSTVPLEWYSRPLQAVTLSGAMLVNVWGNSTTSAGGLQHQYEIAVVNGDGSSPTVLAVGGYGSGATQDEWSTTGDQLGGPGLAGIGDFSVTDGQRLRLRLYIDDGKAIMNSGATHVMKYGATSGGVAGDSFLRLTQTVAEFVSAPGPIRRQPMRESVRNLIRR